MIYIMKLSVVARLPVRRSPMVVGRPSTRRSAFHQTVDDGTSSVLLDALVRASSSPAAHALSTAVTAFVGIYCSLNWVMYREAREAAEEAAEEADDASATAERNSGRGAGDEKKEKQK